MTRAPVAVARNIKSAAEKTFKITEFVVQRFQTTNNELRTMNSEFLKKENIEQLSATRCFPEGRKSYFGPTLLSAALNYHFN